MNGIQIKSYLFPDNSKVSLSTLAQVDEIRRFNLATDGSGSYNALIEKIQLAYGPALSNKDEIRTYWQDEEDELIGFTTDSELQYAIDVQTAIKMSKPYDTQTSKTGLFKVYVARKEQNNDKHFNHMKYHHKMHQQAQQKGTHFGVVCDSCDGPVIGNRFKCLVCPDYDLCETCKAKNVHSEHTMETITTPLRGSFLPPFGARCQRRNGEKRHGCRQNNPLEHVMKNMWNLPELAASSVPLVNNPEQLASFGENLKKFLDPFGIDVSYYVDNMTKGDNAKKDEKKEGMEATKDKPASMTHDDDIEEVVIDKPLNSVNEGLTTTMEAESVELPSAPVQSDMEEESLIDLEKSVNLEAPFKEATSVLNTIAASYTDAVAGSAGMSGSPSMVDGFSLIEIDKELKIIRAIEQLNAMGYSDDGGWLTRLVSAKNGNINAVLDAITPGPKK